MTEQTERPSQYARIFGAEADAADKAWRAEKREAEGPALRLLKGDAFVATARAFAATLAADYAAKALALAQDVAVHGNVNVYDQRYQLAGDTPYPRTVNRDSVEQFCGLVTGFLTEWGVPVQTRPSLVRPESKVDVQVLDE